MLKKDFEERKMDFFQSNRNLGFTLIAPQNDLSPTKEIKRQISSSFNEDGNNIKVKDETEGENQDDFSKKTLAAAVAMADP